MDPDEVSCSRCQAPRYDSNGSPIATMKYLPLKDQLAVLLGRVSSREKILYRSQREAPNDGMMTDYFDGEAWRIHQQHLFDGPYDLALALFVDGFKVFQMSNISLTMIHAVVLNYPPSER